MIVVNDSAYSAAPPELVFYYISALLTAKACIYGYLNHGICFNDIRISQIIQKRFGN